MSRCKPGRMVKHVWYCFVTLYLVCCKLYINGLPYSKEQSWSNLNLSSVPLDLDVRLRRLDLSNNFIRQLHMLALPYLEELDVSANQLDLISEALFLNLAELEVLNLSRNMLNNNLNKNSKALQSISRLRSLDLSMNSLSDEAVKLYLRNKSTLDHLKLTGNVVQRLSHSMFVDCKNLKTIAIDNNLISVIDKSTFEPLGQLDTLNLAQNNLAYICDFKLHHLRYLNLSRNSIVFFITHEDDWAYRLELLDLSFNKLLYFPTVPKLNRLRYLYLQHNNIGALMSEAEMVSEGNALYSEIVYGGQPEQKNYLHSTWRLMPLVHIDLSYNHFRAYPIETLGLLSSLETLNFSHNCIQNITWNIRNDRPVFYSSLKHLDLQSNGLVSIATDFLQTLTQIENLNLQDNSVQPCPPVDYGESLKEKIRYPNVSCVLFGHLRTLKHLNLKKNHIKILYGDTFAKSPIVSLNLANNPNIILQNRALDGLQKTRFLTLSELNMSNAGLVLPCVPALTQLNVSNNNLDRIPSSVSCSPLKELDIRNNIVDSLNQSLLNTLIKYLEVMYISGNPLNCCNSNWLTVLTESKVKLPDLIAAECSTGDIKILMTEYLKSPVSYCFVNKNTPQAHTAQMCIIILFFIVLFTAVFVFCRHLFCSRMSFIV